MMAPDVLFVSQLAIALFFWVLEKGIFHLLFFCSTHGQIGLAVVNQLLPCKTCVPKIKGLGSHITVSGFSKPYSCVETPFRNRTSEMKIFCFQKSPQSRLETLQRLLVLLHDSQWPQTDCFCQVHKNGTIVRALQGNKKY